MNIRTILLIGLVVGMVFIAKDTIGTGFNTIMGRTGHIDIIIDRAVAGTRTVDEVETTASEYQRKSDAAIRHIMECGREEYREENDCE